MPDRSFVSDVFLTQYGELIRPPRRLRIYYRLTSRTDEGIEFTAATDDTDGSPVELIDYHYLSLLHAYRRHQANTRERQGHGVPLSKKSFRLRMLFDNEGQRLKNEVTLTVFFKPDQSNPDGVRFTRAIGENGELVDLSGFHHPTLIFAYRHLR